MQSFGPLTVTDHLSLSAVTETQFAALLLERGIPHSAQSRWATSSCSLDDLLVYALSTLHSTQAQSLLLDLESLFGARALALVTLRGGTVCCHVATDDRAIVTDVERWLHDRLPMAQATARREISVRFWSCSAHGPSSISRTIAVPTLAEIGENYPHAVRQRLIRLLGPDFRPAAGGQLILWHGAPGTGKTYAIRALGWEWRSWCSLHYVVDPEVFFGQRADYMLAVVLGEDAFSFGEEEEDERESKWRLLVLEDTGELLAADAKERTGQGLSRLLNLVDGIVGQGLRVLVLATTNEPVRRLHPAVARPGRCAARVPFTQFSETEATAWLARQGVTASQPTAATLAELFARSEGHEMQREAPVGFSG